MVDELKSAVRDYWNAEPCGSRGFDPNLPSDWAGIERERYELEPYIHNFARFPDGRGREVLEIGVGIGTDHLNWARSGASLSGIDLTQEGITTTRARLASEGLSSDLRVADAEGLPFADDTFDIVYSYGVLHHSPDTEKCMREVHRVLKPGGQARLMVYNCRSWTGVNLWLLHGPLRGNLTLTPRSAIHDHAESPGTKSYTRKELDPLLGELQIDCAQAALQGGDLLQMRLSSKYQNPAHRIAKRFYPRWLVRRLPEFGIAWLITAAKPLNPS